MCVFPKMFVFFFGWLVLTLIFKKSLVLLGIVRIVLLCPLRIVITAVGLIGISLSFVFRVAVKNWRLERFVFVPSEPTPALHVPFFSLYGLVVTLVTFRFILSIVVSAEVRVSRHVSAFGRFSGFNTNSFSIKS